MRILGITLPENKRMEIALTVIYGIGRPLAKKILSEAKVDFGVKSKDLSIEDENTIRSIVDKIKMEGDLKREVASNIKRLKDIKAYKGIRHMRKLPVRGQRTKTNARTLKGKKKTMGTGRKNADKK